MFKSITSISIEGGCYQNPTLLENILSQRLNIVYGKNGSGKSSLAKAIYDYANNSESVFKLKFEAAADDNLKSRIFVYGEDFVLKNVKLASEGLEQIVMIGEQVDLSNQEEHLNALKAQKEKEYDEVKNKNTGALADFGRKQEELLRLLKGKYADREKTFRSLTKNPPIKVEIITEILNLSQRVNLQDYDIVKLTTQIATDTNIVLNAKDAQKVFWVPCNMQNVNNTLLRCRQLLEKKVERVELDERDKRIIEMIHQSGHGYYFNAAKELFVAKNETLCPLCQRPLRDEELEELKNRIKQVFNKESEEHLQELRNAYAELTDLEESLPALPSDVYRADLASYRQALMSVNTMLASVRELLSRKIQDVFTPIQSINNAEINAQFEVYATAAEKIQEDINEFNTAIDRRKQLEKELKENNQILAFLENRQQFEAYLKLGSDIHGNSGEIERIAGEIEKIKKELRQLSSQRSQTKIAVDFINNCLSYVFFEDGRLSLEDADGKFVLKSRGVPVRPDSVSTGERNIIGLAYFFATLFRDMAESERYTNSYLVVIDDPITSFDQENRMGVMTFIKDQMTNLLVENQGSKALVLSHDKRTINMLEDLSISIENEVRYRNRIRSTEENRFSPNVFELHNRTLRQQKKLKSEYAQMLDLVYCFVMEDDPDNIRYVGVGNIIRRMLETYSQMMYNHSDYVKAIGTAYLSVPYGKDSKDVKDKFKKMLTRTVLNVESHSSAIIDMDSFSSTFTRKELQHYAKVALLFMYATNKSHVKAYFRDRDIIQNLDNWFFQF